MASASAPAVGAPIGTITVNAFDLGFDPATVDVAEAGVYTVMFHNTGAVAHDITFADGTKIAAEAGQMETGTVTIPAGGTTFICTIPGHSDAGMTGTVTVAGAAPSPGGDSHGGPAPAPTWPPIPAHRRTCCATRRPRRSSRARCMTSTWSSRRS